MNYEVRCRLSEVERSLQKFSSMPFLSTIVNCAGVHFATLDAGVGARIGEATLEFHAKVSSFV